METVRKEYTKSRPFFPYSNWIWVNFNVLSLKKSIKIDFYILWATQTPLIIQITQTQQTKLVEITTQQESNNAMMATKLTEMDVTLPAIFSIVVMLLYRDLRNVMMGIQLVEMDVVLIVSCRLLLLRIWYWEVGASAGMVLSKGSNNVMMAIHKVEMDVRPYAKNKRIRLRWL